MPIAWEIARHEAEHALVSGNPRRALHLYSCMVEAAPYDCEARVRAADAMALLGFVELAKQAYLGAGRFAALGGHPLPAIIAGRIAAGLGAGNEVLQLVAQTYSVESNRLAKRAARLSAPIGVFLDEKRLAETLPDGQLAERALLAVCSQEGVHFPPSLPAVPLLSLLSREGLESLLFRVGIVRLGDSALLFQQGAASESLFLCAQGRLVVYREGEEHSELAHLAEGALFGETGLLDRRPRGASVRSVGPADLLEVSAEMIAQVSQARPAVTAALQAFRRERLLKNLLHISPLFRPFSPEQRWELLERFEGLSARQGEILLEQGHDGRGLYLIVDGECEVTRTVDGKSVSVAHLKSGEVFGEVSLLHDLPAIATVAASQDTTLLFLPALYFQRLVRRVPEIGEYFGRLAADRLRHTGNLAGDEVLLGVADGMLLG